MLGLASGEFTVTVRPGANRGFPYRTASSRAYSALDRPADVNLGRMRVVESALAVVVALMDYHVELEGGRFGDGGPQSVIWA